MSLQSRRKAVGQLFAVGFHGTEINEDIRTLIRDYGVGAIVLFKRNVRDADQLRGLSQGLQSIAMEAGHSQPLFIGIDQENGLVTRISPPVAAQMPGPMSLGATGSLESTHAVAVATGEMLRHFGINMNYAPIGDVNSEPLNRVIGTRSPGDNPETVSSFAAACARGLREAGVAPCIKHFPGHGDTDVDSHYGLPVIDKSRADLDKTELVPFRDAARQGIEMVMTAHISMPQLGSKLPSTLSPQAIGILRNEFGYDGVIMTDCLEMDGIRATYGTVEGALMAIQAGVDNVMICHTFDVQAAAIDRICAAIDSGELTQQRIDESLNRLSRLKSHFTSWDTALQTGTPEALQSLNTQGFELASGVYRAAATLVRSRPDFLPVSPSALTVFVSPGPNIPVGGGAVDSGDATLPTRVPWVKSAFADTIRHHNGDVVDIRFTETGLTDEQWKQVTDADVVILATRNALESPYQKEMGLEIARRRENRGIVAIATCAPYDFLEDEDAIGTYLAVYEPTVEAFKSAIDVVYGNEKALGKLPVQWPRV
ncbi:Beta-N-acetylhexosaminidase [Purpureocillium takamizusanense]|uniref:Beta-N-acetylhexosaminidase n=1 Tax=Purpureocillium takamizusanense TaxID=2060973 RepID=A0A9Q8VAY4_9HYPO|nr:Beta-N-acetylhexosaminidase [Purpureocillium takamizusanense]UNI18334.1 Beta-N-acetylhexosaminidase [Purpureocillium takamizusanense]